MQNHDERATKQSVANLTVDIVSAYVANNTIPTSQLGQLIADVNRQLHQVVAPPNEEPAKPEPAVPVRRSIAGDHLICLVCGKKQRMLKRHLSSEHQLAPDEYRELFELKVDYPMVAPSYAAMRRDLALKIGLGRPKQAEPKRRPTRKKAASPDTSRTAAKQPKARRSRTKAAPAPATSTATE